MTNPIISKKIQKKSKWLSIVEKQVQINNGNMHIYHSLIIHDYVVVIAKTPSNKIPIVRQYRPAVEKNTWELPAGLLDEGKSPKSIAIQELREEALLDVKKLIKLGTTYADPGRLNCKVHLYYAECTEPNVLYKREENIHVKYVTKKQLVEYILKNEIFAMHVSLLSFGKLKKIKWFNDF